MPNVPQTSRIDRASVSVKCFNLASHGRIFNTTMCYVKPEYPLVIARRNHPNNSNSIINAMSIRNKRIKAACRSDKFYSCSVIKNFGERGDHARGLARDGERVRTLRTADMDNAREVRFEGEGRGSVAVDKERRLELARHGHLAERRRAKQDAMALEAGVKQPQLLQRAKHASLVGVRLDARDEMQQ